jgi:hypothetical protein
MISPSVAIKSPLHKQKHRLSSIQKNWYF